MIVALDESPRAWAVYPGGQSGNPGSRYYDNFISTWESGQYYELSLEKSPEDIENVLFSVNITPN
jgi:penicillin amidase